MNQGVTVEITKRVPKTEESVPRYARSVDGTCESTVYLRRDKS